jgi:Leucine-rich repeat (LRR) protein
MSVFFDKHIWSRIFHHLPIEQAKEWALLSKSMYHASRLGSAMNMRWKITNASILNVLSKQFFVHLIQAVEVRNCSVLTCLYYLNVKITNVRLSIHASDMYYKKSDFINFDQITELSVCFKQPISKFGLMDLPCNLKSLAFIDGNSCNVTIPPILPESLEYLHIDNCKITNLKLPNGLKDLFYDHKEFFKHVPKLPLGIHTLRVVGDFNGGHNWRLFHQDVIYPNLKRIEIIANDPSPNRQITIYTKGLPALKYAEVTKMSVVNDGRLYMRHMHVWKEDPDITVCKFGDEEEEKERPNKKIKNLK